MLHAVCTPYTLLWDLVSAFLFIFVPNTFHVSCYRAGFLFTNSLCFSTFHCKVYTSHCKCQEGTKSSMSSFKTKTDARMQVRPWRTYGSLQEKSVHFQHTIGFCLQVWSVYWTRPWRMSPGPLKNTVCGTTRCWYFPQVGTCRLGVFSFTSSGTQNTTLTCQCFHFRAERNTDRVHTALPRMTTR